MCLATSNNLLLMLQDAPKHIFHKTAIFWSAKKQCKDTIFFHPPFPFPGNFCYCNSGGICTASQILGLTSIVIHSVKQHLLRNLPGSDAVTPRDFWHERLQRAFTCADLLH